MWPRLGLRFWSLRGVARFYSFTFSCHPGSTTSRNAMRSFDNAILPSSIIPGAWVLSRVETNKQEQGLHLCACDVEFYREHIRSHDFSFAYHSR